MPTITVADVRSHLDRTGGRRHVDPEDLAIAIHEAGHAIVAMALRYRVTKLTRQYVDQHGWKGLCYHEAIDRRNEGQRRATIAVAAHAAINLFGEGSIQYTEQRMAKGNTLIASDQRMFDDSWTSLGAANKREAKALAITEAREILRAHPREMQRVVYAFMRQDELKETDLQSLCGELATRWKQDVQTDIASTMSQLTPTQAEMVKQLKGSGTPALRRQSSPPLAEVLRVPAGSTNLRYIYADGTIVHLKPGDQWPTG